MANKIIYGDEAKSALQRGVDTVANCVKVTLGAKGRFVGLDKSYGAPLITNDGVTIAKEIQLVDDFENMGSKLVCEASSKTNTDSGDGTTTAILLAQALVNNGVKIVTTGYSPIMVKKGMEKAVDKVVEYIKETAIPVRGADDIAKVATISSRDSHFGEIISDIIEKLGENVVITVEDSNTGDTTYEIVEGLQFDKGFIAPHMVTDVEKMVAEYDNPLILITDQKINNIQDIMPILESAAQGGRNLLIISDDMTNEVTGTLIANKLRGALNVVCVKPPKFGEMREAWLEDIAVLTNGTFINSKLGMLLKDVTIQQLGTAKKIKVTKDNTTIIGGAGSKESIDNRVASIRADLDNASSKFDKDNLKERLSKLTSGVAIIRVGAATEVELKDKKLRLEDALAATRAAIDEGVVPGGGVALIGAAHTLDELYAEADNQEKEGIKVVQNALSVPFMQIIANAGGKSDAYVYELNSDRTKKIENCGVDVSNMQFVNMVERGIIDPAKVTRSALQNAMSVAGMILTTEVLVTKEPEKKTNELM